MSKYYTGIGSRSTPRDILDFMTELAVGLYRKGYTLRSGGAPGADQAFERGVANEYENEDGWPCHEIYLPWASFERDSRSWLEPARTKPQEEAYSIAAKYHPRWKFLTPGAMALHARNVHQVLGYDVTNPEPSEFIICWTEGARGGGGTGQAIRIAKDLNIPIYDLADPDRMWAITALILEDDVRAGA